MNVTDLIKRHEGLRLKPYKCSAGKLTIGYGRNIEDNGITDAEAEFMLNRDVTAAVIELERSLPFMHRRDEVRRAVLIDMCFNMGAPRLLTFEKTLLLVDAGEYEAASVEMLDSKWADQVGKRALTLSKMMFSGEWS